MMEIILENEPAIRLAFFLGFFALMILWEFVTPRRERSVSRWVAMSTGRPLKRVGANLAGSVFSSWRGKDGSTAKAHFEALKRVLDAEAPGYAQ